MNISILGPLRVSAGQAQLTHQDFGGTKPRELLALLLLARGRPISKDALAERLWPTRKPKNVAGTLETYVSGLRRVLFPDRAMAREVLRTQSGAYAFDTSAVTLDIDRFDELVKRSARPGSDRAALLTEATELVRGDLLEDLGDAPWLLADRELYRDRCTRALLSLAEAHLCLGAWAAALDASEAASRIRPFSEEAVRTMMLAYHALGHDDAARLAFERTRDRLASELATDPTTETEDLAGAISAGVPAAELLAERGIGPVPPSAPIGTVDGDRRDPGRQLPFLGRVAELERIRDHIDGSRAGELRVLAVRAGRGLGKTALLDQLHETTSGRVGRQSYTFADRERPGLPVARALRSALAGGSGQADAEAYANSPYFGDDQVALDQLLSIIDAHAPMVLLLDDFEWADLATVTAIAWLVREAPSLPLTIVAAERIRRRRASRLLDLVHVDDEIRLGPLGPEVATNDAVQPDVVTATGGMPSLMVDTVRWVRAGGEGPSPSLRYQVFRSIRGLSGGQRALLQLLAGIDGGADPFELSQRGVLSPAATVAALDELVELEVLEHVGSRYCFRAPIVGDVIAGSMPRRAEPRAVGASEPRKRRGLDIAR